jgi:hypothetical protein
MSKKIDCKEVITIPQFTGTCWFNALLMTLLYSDGMRSYLTNNLHNSAIEKDHPKLYKIIMDILLNRYRKIDEKEKVFFDELKPENILSLLHETNKEQFYFNPDESIGHRGEYYFVRLFDFLGLKQKVLFLNKKSDTNVFHYSVLNRSPVIFKTPKKSYYWRYLKQRKLDMQVRLRDSNPDILVVTSMLSEYVHDENIVMTTKENDLQEIIEYNGNFYQIDSLMLVNFNNIVCKLCHQIAGVTCNNNRYLYNGWIKNTQDPANKTGPNIKSPCELMPYDWLEDKSDFCLNTLRCGVHKRHSDYSLCFNISKGDTTYVYVKIDKPKVDAVKQSPAKKKTDLKRLQTQLITKQIICNKQINDLKDKITQLKKEEVPKEKTPKKEEVSKKKTPKKEVSKEKDKTCPDDKILNPKTGRCVLKTGKLGKELLKSR